MIHVIAGPAMPDASELHIPGAPLPPDPGEQEIVALHAAAQLDRGATAAETVEVLLMLGVFGVAADMRFRQHAERARTTAARAEAAQVLAVKPRRRRRRAS